MALLVKEIGPFTIADTVTGQLCLPVMLFTTTIFF